MIAVTKAMEPLRNMGLIECDEEHMFMAQHTFFQAKPLLMDQS